MHEQILAYRVAAQTLAFVLVALAAWRWGDKPEWALAGVLLWLRLSDWAYHAVFPGTFQLAEIDLAHALIDGVACVAALAVALHANRIYPLWFAAVQLLAVFAHLSREMAVDILPRVYAIMSIAPSYLQILILALGIWLHHRRVSRHGPYRSWRRSSNLSPEAGPDGWPSG